MVKCVVCCRFTHLKRQLMFTLVLLIDSPKSNYPELSTVPKVSEKFCIYTALTEVADQTWQNKVASKKVSIGSTS